MTIHRLIIPALALAGTLAAQTFIQMSDPQFGMYTSDASFERETANFEFAVASANRVKPAFVVITGDLVNKAAGAAQVAEYKRIAARLDPGIKLYSVAGNHDLDNDTSAATLARYRERFGADYYSFHSGAIAGIVLDSNLEKDAGKVPAEAAKMETWFRGELERAKLSGARHIVVFQHVPFFVKDPAEPEEYFNIPKPVRERYLHLLHEYGVEHVFAGHLHHNEIGHDGDLEMVTTGPVGKPLEGGKSGFRVVIVKDGKLTHQFYDFGDLP
jgi:3',5'-cyclic AMP phosphodiesterase CpdA